jgi:hypothetical protein
MPDASALARELVGRSATDAWSELSVLDTAFGLALYGEHPPGADRPWPLDEAVELTQIFHLPDLLDQRKGPRS